MQVDKLEIRKVHKTAIFLGLAFVGSVFIYTLLVELANRKIINLGTAPVISGLETLKYIFLGLTFITLFAIRGVKHNILSGKVKLQPNSGLPTPLTGPLIKLMRATLVGYAFCESVALYGLVYYFLSGNIQDFYLFIILSLFLFARHFPRYQQWESWLSGINEKPPNFDEVYMKNN
jgi:F0F1-type ATP synthase membrane subunit c/vacuolar-type H+-ATPase subunit K